VLRLVEEKKRMDCGVGGISLSPMIEAEIAVEKTVDR